MSRLANCTISNVLFISHGGGPLPLLGDKGHKEMVDELQSISKQIKKPDAILIISAHWEERVPTITASSQPSLIYDYFGFPKESYEIKYPCKGEPELAKKVFDVLDVQGLKPKLDVQRGLDHGVFVPMKIMYPQADIPCIQLSLCRSLDPELHQQIGRALQGLSYENLLVIGSGFSFHNLKAFFAEDIVEREQCNVAFEDWLVDVMINSDLDETERATQLNQWDKISGARYCHPREEHLLPLHVCYGLAQSKAQQHYVVDILGVKSSMYLW